MTLNERLAKIDKRRLALYASVAVLALVLVFSVPALFIGADGNAAPPGGSAGEKRSLTLRGGELAGELLFPGADPYEPQFPLVREPATRYTIEDVKRLLPDPASLDVGALREKRKASLEILYSAVD